jgi:hypothetical protein
MREFPSLLLAKKDNLSRPPLSQAGISYWVLFSLASHVDGLSPLSQIAGVLENDCPVTPDRVADFNH